MMEVISVRQHPGLAPVFIGYFQEKWKDVDGVIYEDCISHCLTAAAPLPQWYLLRDGGEIIGGAGLITNDFISRSDLYPWLCALYIEKEHRGNGYASLLVDKAKSETKASGFSHLYLCTGHTGYYEKLGFTYIGDGYHPWGESSRIYQIKL